MVLHDVHVAQQDDHLLGEGGLELVRRQLRAAQAVGEGLAVGRQRVPAGVGADREIHLRPAGKHHVAMYELPAGGMPEDREGRAPAAAALPHDLEDTVDNRKGPFRRRRRNERIVRAASRHHVAEIVVPGMREVLPAELRRDDQQAVLVREVDPVVAVVVGVALDPVHDEQDGRVRGEALRPVIPDRHRLAGRGLRIVEHEAAGPFLDLRRVLGAGLYRGRGGEGAG